MREEWEIKTLSDIVTFQRGLTYSKGDEVKHSTNIVLRSNNIDLTTNQLNLSELRYIKQSIKISREKKVNKGSLIICTANGSKTHLGKVALINRDYDYAFGGFMGQLTPSEDVDSKFLFYALTSEAYKKFISELSDGANINNLRFDDLKKFSFRVPPLSKQKHIVEILDETFAAIDKAKANFEKNLQNAKELFESYLKSLFENPIDNWEKKRWGDLCHFVRGPFGGSLKKSIFKEDGYVVYEQKHAIHDHFNQLRYFIDEDKFNEMLRFEVKPGDIIMSCSGVTLGRVAIVPNGIKRGIINQALLKLTPKKNVSINFLKHWLRSKVFQDIIFEYSGGAAIPNVPAAKILKDILIPLPSLEEQNKVVNDIELMSVKSKKLENIYQQKLNDLEELKKSILQKAFNGELTATTKLYVTEQSILSIAAEPEVSYKRASSNELNEDEKLQLYFMLLNIAFHNNKPEQGYLAEVKMEKSCHLGENTIQSLKFNRNPIKAMNGPADFERLFKLHDYASANEIFNYEKYAPYKKYIEGENFMKYFGKASAAFRPFINQVNTLLKILLPLKTDTIDIYATTYAAWNNLMILKKEITPIAIAEEGRWHEKKVRFTDADFEEAIEFLKANNLVPIGAGKLVKDKNS